MNDKEREKLASQFDECIRSGDEFDKWTGVTYVKFSKLLEKVTEPEEASWVCSVGVCLYPHAIRAYDHAWSLSPEPPILFNKAVCLDDQGARDEAIKTLREFAAIVTDPDELETVKRMLTDNGKSELWESATTSS